MNNKFICTCPELMVFQLRWYRIAGPGFSFHLIYIPVGRKKTCVNYSYIPAVTFNLLHIPKGKSVIITNGEKYCIFIYTVQVHFGHRKGSIPVRSIMVIPVL